MLLYIYIYMCVCVCVLRVENTHKIHGNTHSPHIPQNIYTHTFRGTVHPLYPHNIPMIPPFLLGIGHHSCWLNSNIFHGSIRWKIPHDRITISVARSPLNHHVSCGYILFRITMFCCQNHPWNPHLSWLNPLKSTSETKELPGTGAGACYLGFQLPGATWQAAPIAGWFRSWKIPAKNGWSLDGYQWKILWKWMMTGGTSMILRKTLYVLKLILFKGLECSANYWAKCSNCH